MGLHFLIFRGTTVGAMSPIADGLVPALGTQVQMPRRLWKVFDEPEPTQFGGGWYHLKPCCTAEEIQASYLPGSQEPYFYKPTGARYFRGTPCPD